MKDHVIYNLWNGGLGDHWASISLLARLSLHTGREISFSSQGEHEGRHREILTVLNLGKARLMRHLGPGNTALDGFNVWATEYFPTFSRWRDDKLRPFVCGHFAGVSAADDKNPSAEETHRIAAWCKSHGFELLILSGQTDLKLVVQLMSHCVLFVGCDSGMSHIAHSVGTPSYILQYRLPVVTCHRNKAYVQCNGAGHFMQQADNWVTYLRFTGALPEKSDPELHY